MRKVGVVLAAFFGLALGLEALGQQTGGFWTGTNPRNVQFKPIDTSKAMKAFPTSKAFHNPTPQRTFNLERAFPRLTLGSWPPKAANVTVLDQKKNPFQPTPPKGFNPFDEFNKKGKKDKK